MLEDNAVVVREGAVGWLIVLMGGRLMWFVLNAITPGHAKLKFRSTLPYYKP